MNKLSKKVAVSVFCETSEMLIEMFRSSKLAPGRIYEIRYDLFSRRSLQDMGDLVHSLNSLGISYIFTFRGTEGEVLEYARKAAEACAPAIDIDNSIDVDFDTSSISLIRSVHLYGSRPTADLIEGLLNSSCDLVKLAVSYSGPAEFLEDAAMVSRMRMKSDKPLAFVPMGKNSAPLRVASLLLLSDLAYARNVSSTADGQPLYEEYMSVMDLSGN